MKGNWCPYANLFCQESARCPSCQIFLDWLKPCPTLLLPEGKEENEAVL